jgi:hypothetical protein
LVTWDTTGERAVSESDVLKGLVSILVRRARHVASLAKKSKKSKESVKILGLHRRRKK